MPRLSKHYYSKKPKPTIDDLAFKFLEGRYPIGRLRQCFGRRESHKAITRMASVMLLCEPEHGKSLEWIKATKQEELIR